MLLYEIYYYSYDCGHKQGGVLRVVANDSSECMKIIEESRRWDESLNPPIKNAVEHAQVYDLSNPGIINF